MLFTVGAVKKRAQSCGPWWNGPSGLDWLVRPNNTWPFFSPNFFISINAYFLFLKFLIIFTLIPLLSFILFRETLLNDGDFLVMCLIFEDVFLIHLWFFFFYLLYRWTIFFKIKNIYFQMIFLICVALRIIFFLFFYSINLMFVYFYYHLIK
jgi:hypothetical protein